MSSVRFYRLANEVGRHQVHGAGTFSRSLYVITTVLHSSDIIGTIYYSVIFKINLDDGAKFIGVCT